MKFHLSNFLFAVLPLTVYGSNLKSTRVANELGDQQRRTLTDLNVVAANPTTAQLPLGLCEGHCDNDDECEGSLVCYERDDNGPNPPGCNGTPLSDHDYCIVDPNIPATVLMNVVAANPTAAQLPLALCEGDCDIDDDCEGSLVCYERDDNGPNPPGCKGTPLSDNDYCIVDPSVIVSAPEYDIELASSGCVFNVGGTNTIGNIVCTFSTRGGVDYAVASSLYNADCSAALTSTDVVLDDTNSGFSPKESTSTTQFESPYAVTLPLANSAATEATNNIAFCLNVEVSDKDGLVYDWTEQKIVLNVNVDGSFTTESLSTTTFNGNEEPSADLGTSSFGVGIKRCDADGNEVANDNELSMGENFFLCVEGNQDIIVINSIGELTASKDGTVLALVKMNVNGSGEGETNANTFVYGNGKNQVVIATRLPATFFVSPGTVRFEGNANISTGRRRLSRSMQVSTSSEADESADFSMDIRVAGMDDASGASAISSTAAMFFAVVAALIL